jgi:hypothetical protein
MTTIQIKKSELISELTNSLQYAGSTEWDLYVHVNGALDTRHNTYENADWHELIDLYNCAYDGTDFENQNDRRALAEWMIEEQQIPSEIEIEVDTDDGFEFRNADIELVD